MNMGYELWLACYNVAYLFDHTPFYRPWLAWMNVDLRRLGPDDFVSFFSSPRCCILRLNFSAENNYNQGEVACQHHQRHGER